MSKPQIFISPGAPDDEWVRAFAKALEGHGAEVWVDQVQIRAGERIQEAIEKGLRASDVIAFVVPPDQAFRPNALFELGAAVGMGKLAVPIIPRGFDVSRLPYPLRVRKYVWRGTPEDTARRLLVETAVGETGK